MNIPRIGRGGNGREYMKNFLATAIIAFGALSLMGVVAQPLAAQ
jgi:hypothetical protein